MSPLLGASLVVILALIGFLALPKKLGAKTPAGVPAVPPATKPAKYLYADLFEKWAGKYGLDPDLPAAHAKVESNFNPSAVNEEDPRLDYDSSYGIMQVQLAVAQDFGAVKDYRHATAAEISWLMDVSNNIKVGTWNAARWQKKYPFDTAVQMYNVGENGYLNKGRRNISYLEKVREAFNGYNAS